eukprot:TRINITY_DN1259_c15_g1_i1.p1 TRINITY_DN1259_c15_g1~~TRINITY_DN1259_c15_g1_i1.p1  ORF type:complete len:6161 (+),score=1442.86 TRINITY_DN1259_c15_g1_i1:2253-18485(+)
MSGARVWIGEHECGTVRHGATPHPVIPYGRHDGVTDQNIITGSGNEANATGRGWKQHTTWDQSKYVTPTLTDFGLERQDEVLVCEDYVSPTLLPSYAPGNYYENSPLYAGGYGHHMRHPTIAAVHPSVHNDLGINLTQFDVEISFTRRPEVTGVRGCTHSPKQYGYNHTWDCWTNGTMPITVTGRYFVGGSGLGKPHVWVGPYPCLNTLTISDTELVCTAYPGLGQDLRVEVRRAPVGQIEAGVDGIGWRDYERREEFVEISGPSGVAYWVEKYASSSSFAVLQAASTWMAANIHSEDLRLSYRLRPVVRTISGCGCPAGEDLGLEWCTVESSNHTVLCSTEGITPITLTGFNFGTSGAEVWVGSRTVVKSKKCDSNVHDATNPDNKIVCSGYTYTGSYFRVTVVQHDEESVDPILLSFQPGCPYWNNAARRETVMHSNNGTVCNSHGYCELNCPFNPATCVCNRSASTGYWDGRVCQDCLYGYWGRSCTSECQGSASNPCSSHGLCTGGIEGDGECLCHEGYGGRSCDLMCPRDTRSRICGGFISACSNGTTHPSAAGYGTYDRTRQAGDEYGTGVCVCPDAADPDGKWTGVACDSCQAGWHSLCRKECPGGYATPCNNRGTCAQGPEQNGTCTCNVGYAGLACELSCDGGPTNPCNFHGECDALTGKCTCHATVEQGFWAGTECDQCDYGYSGKSASPVGCVTPCPRNSTGAVCSHIGTCTNGLCFCPETIGDNIEVCGEACNVTGKDCDIYSCPDGFAGPSCTIACAGYSVTDAGQVVVCSGHGQCDEGQLGTARCSCAAGYGKASCDTLCPGATANTCYGRGTCNQADALCDCYKGFAGSDCLTECAGGATTPCNGHGTCNEGKFGDGTCTCNYGYLGTECLGECPGGAATPCNKHGNCTSAGLCLCENNPDDGHWAGSECNQCLPDWFGADCLRTCPKNELGQNCSGHGACPGEVEICVCEGSTITGFWVGTLCSECKSGYWGSECKSECPGSACDPCAGHGICNDGLNGGGWCNCTFNTTHGFWGSSDCSRCHSGYYGTDCTKPCPGGAAYPCSSHGTCLDGRFGEGTCQCFSDPNGAGVWGGTTCSDCASGWWSANCSVRCPLYPEGSVFAEVCNGQGTCNDGVNGDGTCNCFTGKAGFSCEKACPLDSAGLICGGFTSACDGGRLGSANCHCPRSTTQGFWIEPVCDDCFPGYGGPNCLDQCPGGSGLTCSGHGSCTDGVKGSGSCVCVTGYVGTDCEIECPGGAANACSNHGTCESDGSCTCHSTTNLGFWTGASCQLCQTGWSGVDCDKECPTATVSGSSQVCAGRGICLDGKCFFCEALYCGDSCELGGPTDVGACSCCLCAAGKYGSDCSGECFNTEFTDPLNPTVCGGHGYCSDGKSGDGTCTCVEGWAGAGCSIECPGGQANICNGNGVCNQTTGDCVCKNAYAQVDCRASCPGLATFAGICSSHGSCKDGATGDASCVCFFGYAGPSCEKECAGGVANPCSGHGTCDKTSGECTCANSAAAGFFTGLECQNCQNGFFGEDCKQVCQAPQGNTLGHLCLCSSGWAMPDCSVSCVGGAALPCSGHGDCNDTYLGDGSCTCNVGFRTPDCSVRCAGHEATGKECSGRGVCMNDGSCACHHDLTRGFWNPPDCGSCFGEYFGRNCDQLCPKGSNGKKCSGHGECGLAFGICECASDVDVGFWTGDVCDACKPGYYGGLCSSECPGGACTPCNGHGECSDGVGGTGQCTCTKDVTLGFWKGLACADCIQGYWGSRCASQCPLGLTPETWCSGHGDCNQGPRGTGDCLCFENDASGYWTGTLCNECKNGYWGAACNTRCPGDGVPCSGNGNCNDGLSGDGTCSCKRGYSGAGCDASCPRGPNGDFCSGATYRRHLGQLIEACDWGAPGQFASATGGTAQCTCPGFNSENGAEFGFLTGFSCAVCRDGYAGQDCKVVCPGVDADGVCTGHGRCEDGRSGTGACTCNFGYGGDACDVTCVGGALLPCAGNGICQKGNLGTPYIEPGSCQCFDDDTYGHWQTPDCQSCKVGYSGRRCNIACPISGGEVCSGHGTCYDGKCYCEQTTEPYCGNACENFGWVICTATYCPPGLYGIECQNECRPYAALPCSGHGVCDSGRFGSGRCVCNSGYATADCSTVCDGGALFPCTGNNGFCNQDTGKCECKSGFATFDCSVTCPGGTGAPCNGHGECSQGAAGDGSCTCHAGYAGGDCSLVCPGGAASPCSFHGTCSDTAVCSCFATLSQGFWQGTSCDSCQSGYYGSGCNIKCNFGDTVNGQCICFAGYADENCTTECNGFVSEGWQTPCAGHGTCSDGNTGDGTCACDISYAGRSCDARCPGPLGVPCNAHGTCDSAGACACFDSADLGHWGVGATGEMDCSTCVVGWFGENCDKSCPSKAEFPILCSGHGDCDPVRIECVCYANATAGHWAGHDCSECEGGWWGVACESECPGTHCNPCFGHGACFDGPCPPEGCAPSAGTCNCSVDSGNGYWTHADCHDCEYGFYSNGCDRYCPGGVGNICSHRGNCSMGVQGGGACDCLYGRDTGFWGLDACQDCWPAFYGAGCLFQCDGGIADVTTGKLLPCTGHGTCSSGRAGTGSCTCHTGYAGFACNIACPSARILNMEDFEICTGHGQCSEGVDGDGTCQCVHDDLQGKWVGHDCSRCKAGYWGTNCIEQCPGGYQFVCSAHGKCDEGPGGSGLCTCIFGWAGLDCSTECTGGSSRPCTGRGACQPDGTCRCHADPVAGYWSGELCDRCDPWYSGQSCTESCPTNGTREEGGSPCASLGVCRGGQCFKCPEPFCNGPLQACDLWGDACADWVCSAGLWGSQCENVCPGGAGALACTGHGLCQDGRRGTGVCACDAGYMFADCSQACPGGATTPCTDHGICDVAAGVCVCFTGYAQESCAKECPGGYYNPCSSNGRCDEGAQGTGTCTCNLGWAGEICNVECIGGYANPCTGHGRCSTVDGSCTCHSNSKDGFWTSESCDMCQQGYFGLNCTTACVQGTSVARYTDNLPGALCECHPFWATEDCSTPCPRGNNSRAEVCSGHGSCADGRLAVGTCQCQQDYYSENCGRHCHPDLECSQPPTAYAHAQCNPVTGECECQDDEQGHWTGAQCDQCKQIDAKTGAVDAWWGDLCNKPCLCNNHGGCTRDTGTCICFENAQYGFWAGEFCESCKNGYVGFDCMSPNVHITRTTDFGPPLRFEMKVTTSGVTLRDDAHSLNYVGGRPLLVFNSATEALLDYLDLLAAVIGGWIDTAANAVFLTTDDDRIWSFRRGVANLSSAQIGDPVFTGNSLTEGDITFGAREKMRAQGNVPDKPARRRWAQALMHPSSEAEELMLDSGWETYSGVDENEVRPWDPQHPWRLSATDAKKVLASVKIGPRNQTMHSVREHRRRFPQRVMITQANLGLKLVRALEDADHSLVYLVWSGQFARQIYYHRSPDMTLVRVIDLSTQIDDIMDAALHKESAMLVLSGRKGSQWEIVLFKTPTLSIEKLSQRVTIPDCGTCREAAKAALSNGVLYVAVMISEGFKVVRIDLRTNAAIGYDTLRNMRTNDIGVSELQLDEASGGGYVFAHVGADPTTAYKFYLNTLRVYGTNEFLRSGSAVERVINAYSDKLNRVMFCLVSVGRQTKIVRLNMFALWSLTPNVADTRGGTIVTVRGEGFVSFGQTCCRTGGGATAFQYSKAHANTGQHVECKMPSSPGGEGTCAGQPVEVTILGGATCDASSPYFSENQLTVLRTPTAKITRVAPYFDVHQGGKVVTVTGIGFVDSPYLRCKWFSRDRSFDPPDGDAIYAGKNAALVAVKDHPSHNLTYLNSFTILCRQPPSYLNRPSLIPSYLEVSLDGQQSGFSESKIEYAIHGRPASLAAESPVLQVPAEEFTLVPPMPIVVLDSSGHKLMQNDQSDQRYAYRRGVQMTVTRLQPDDTSNGATNLTLQGQTRQTMLLGRVVFGNITLHKPPTGAIRLNFSHEIRQFAWNSSSWAFETSVLATWTTHVDITVVPGEVVALFIARQPSASTSHSAELPLGRQPEVQFTDPAGNIITSPTSTIGVEPRWMPFIWNDTAPVNASAPCPGPGMCPCTIAGLRSLNYSWAPTNQEVCYNAEKSSGVSPVFMDKNGKVTYQSLTLIGFHGVIYKIRFSVRFPASLAAKVAPVDSNWISVGSCVPTDSTYALEFSDLCLPCPTNAICDGTTQIRPQANHWRATNLSTTFYSCAAHSPCIANATCNTTGCDGVCDTGHTGPQCSVCLPKYGKAGTQCISCPPKAQIDAYIAALVFVGAGILCFVVRSNLKIKSEKEKLLPIMFKMLVSHMQVSSRVGEFGTQFPGLMNSIFAAQSSAGGGTSALQSIPLECANGGGGKHYPVFVGWMIIPGGIIFFACLIATGIRLLIKFQDTKSALKRSALKSEKRAQRLADRHLSKNIYGRTGVKPKKEKKDDETTESESTELVSTDDEAAPGTLALAETATRHAINLEAITDQDEKVTDHSRPSIANWLEDEKPKFKEKERDRKSLGVQQLLTRRGTLSHTEKKVLERSRRFLQTWLLAFIIILYFIYPNLIQEACNMLRCIPIKFEDDVPYRWPDSERPEVAAVKPASPPGNPNDRTPNTGRVESFLEIDLAVNCGEPEYQRYRQLAIIFALGYGVGVPFLSAAVVRGSIQRAGFVGATRQFGFLLMGYKETAWWWEAVVMLRKLIIVFVVVFIQDSRLQTFIGMWSMTIFLCVHLRKVPFDWKLLNHLEAFSMAAIIVTLNLSLLYHWELSIMYNLGLTLAIALINLAVVVVFIGFLFREAVKKALDVLRNNKITGAFFVAADAAASQVKRLGSVFRRTTSAEKVAATPARERASVEFDDEDLERKHTKLRHVTHTDTLPNFAAVTEVNIRHVLDHDILSERMPNLEEIEAAEGSDTTEPAEDEVPAPTGGAVKWPIAMLFGGEKKKEDAVAQGWDMSIKPTAPKWQPYFGGGRWIMPEPSAPPRQDGDGASVGEVDFEEGEESEEPWQPDYGDDDDPWTERVAQIAQLGDVDGLQEDMGIDENTRFTRKQAAFEAAEGNIVHAAYKFSHLRPEGAGAQYGISDAEARQYLSDWRYGIDRAREHAVERGLTDQDLLELWDLEVEPFLEIPEQPLAPAAPGGPTALNPEDEASAPPLPGGMRPPSAAAPARRQKEVVYDDEMEEDDGGGGGGGGAGIAYDDESDDDISMPGRDYSRPGSVASRVSVGDDPSAPPPGRPTSRPQSAASSGSRAARDRTPPSSPGRPRPHSAATSTAAAARPRPRSAGEPPAGRRSGDRQSPHAAAAAGSAPRRPAGDSPQSSEAGTPGRARPRSAGQRQEAPQRPGRPTSAPARREGGRGRGEDRDAGSDDGRGHSPRGAAGADAAFDPSDIAFGETFGDHMESTATADTATEPASRAASPSPGGR